MALPQALENSFWGWSICSVDEWFFERFSNTKETGEVMVLNDIFIMKYDPDRETRVLSG